MDVAAIASALAGAQLGQVQFALAATMLRMNADMEAAVAQLVQSGQQSLDRLANVAAGVGTNVDITA